MSEIHVSLQLIRDFIEISRRYARRGLTTGGGGGISIRVPESDHVLIKGWEVASEDVREEDISLVNLSGEQLNPVKPCMETPLHLNVLKARENIGAVIHAHSPYATAFGNIKPQLTEEALKNHAFLKRTVFTAYADPGSQELADIVAEPFREDEVTCVLMEDHGVTVAGPDIYKAYYTLDILEGRAKSFIITTILQRLTRLP
ncbi:MAG: class II aldolase/adducin family protein [Deltaproteobacteria bacterium]|nr:class II aldolase/adducin family protein [Deltaproteobacteria bacterium]MBW2308223.1 class II aldolase/adducin family protein [Deltaproteobacteria bacterium]